MRQGTGLESGVNDTEKQVPRFADGGRRRVEEREDRQARALRENLLRRKAQQRARSASAPAASARPDGPAEDA